MAILYYALPFRVGVVGHRPERLQAADLPVLSTQLRSVLSTVRLEAERVAPRPVLRAVSPLAEGADRLFAAAALDLGYELICPMPFPQAEFERDFLPPCSVDPDSLEQFRRLLTRAAHETGLTRIELPGDRAEAADAYGACGRAVIDHSDLLVAVWDGKRTHKRGGTEETIDDARAARLPIVWIDARAPHAWHFVDGRADWRAGTPDLRALRTTVARTLER